MASPIVCAIAMRATSEHVLQRAVAIAQEREAPLVLLHVLFTPSDTDYQAEPSGEDPPTRTTLWQGMVRKAQAQMQQYLAPLQRKGIEARSVFVDGITSVAIRECATSEGAQLIVLGKRPKSRLKTLLFGCIADNVQQDGQTPVEVVALNAPPGSSQNRSPSNK